MANETSCPAGSEAASVVGALFSEGPGWTAVHLTARAGWSLVFLVVCGTVLGMASYTWLLRVTSPAAVGTYAFVNPVIALLLGRAVGDDQLGPRTLVAAGLVVAAVVLIQRAATRLRPAAHRPDRKLPGDASVESRARSGALSRTQAVAARPWLESSGGRPSLGVRGLS